MSRTKTAAVDHDAARSFARRMARATGKAQMMNLARAYLQLRAELEVREGQLSRQLTDVLGKVDAAIAAPEAAL